MIKDKNIILTVDKVSKAFPGVKALDEVSLELRESEVHALVGENGAGKSTLMQILAGIYKRDEGIISIQGIEYELESKHAAEKAGIGIVFQESSLLQNLSVLENLFNGEPPVNRFGLVDWEEMNNRGRSLLKELNIKVDLQTIVGTLSTATQKMIEIARALSKDFKILILDEPTASITVEETGQLFTLIKKLKLDGKSLIYISHRIKEITEIADRVSILKDGKSAGTYDISEITEMEICSLMVGREILNYKYESHIRDEVLLEVDSLSGEKFSNISFSLKKGEFLVITGLTGAGRTELALSLFGSLPILSGSIFINDIRQKIRTTWEAMKAGIGYVSEDRQKLSLFMDMSIAENMESNNIDSLNSGLFVSRKKTELMAQENTDLFNIKCSGINQKIRDLSGGNKQKVCLSRWISYHPKVLIIDEPTLGVDVGSKEEIYNILNKLAQDGMSIIMVSSDMIETLSVGDRIMVMYEGTIMGILDRAKTNEEEVVRLTSGIGV